MKTFARALDALRAEVERSLGDVDVDHIRRTRRLSRRLEQVGRSLIHFSFEPSAWSAGVVALTGHKLLELIEIGHSVLHGAYDHLPVGQELCSQTFVWRAPIHEESWRKHHNLRHHQFTSVSGRDPDMDFGTLRLASSVPFRAIHRLQPLSNLVSWLFFSAAINAHVTGFIANHFGSQDGRKPRPDGAAVAAQERHGFAKLGRYYAREYLLFPALAGPFAWKILLGNAASEVLRDLYAGATIYCGHVGASEFPEGTHARGRAEWYVLQVEGSRNFEVGGMLALLCGGLECQIEHHLFPRLPPNRLREIAPQVRALCQQHGVVYRSASWPRVLRDVFRRLRELRSPDADQKAPLERPGRCEN